MMLNNDSTDQIRATEMLEDMVHLSLNNVAAAAAAASASTSGNNNSGGGNSSSSTNSASSTASTVSSATSASATPAPPPPAPPTTTGHYSILARKFKLYFWSENSNFLFIFQASHHRHLRLLHPWEMWPIWPICRLRSGQRPSPAERLSTTSRTTMLEETPTMWSQTRARSANCRLRYNSTASS